ncbi:MAG TPA: hypothetical protein DCF63_15765 [Planctomycetaceae bacterium]|nr:hypothetical protein [Planctomycetaceae bacterium]
MIVNNISTSDFTLRGNLRSANYTASNYSFNADGTVLTLSYVSLPDDDYTLTLTAGSFRGFNFTDIYGNALDGEFSGTFPSGNGTAGGNFVIGFDLDLAIEPFTSVLTTRNPPGSLIYSGSLTSTIAFPGDVDSFTMNIDPDQTISVIVTPVTTGLQPRVELFSPAAASLGFATASAPGQMTGIQTLATTSGGTYRINVSGLAASQGRYTVEVILNAAFEQEGKIGGATNNTTTTAENINGSFVNLDTTQARPQRGAVLGTLETFARYTATAVPFEFTDISTTGATLLNCSSSSTATVNLPFAFNFYGTSYTTLYPSRNGLITFGSSNSSTFNDSLSSSPSQAAIAPFWDSLRLNNSTGDATVKFQVLGEVGSRQAILQWNKVATFFGSGGSNTLTFQAILSEGSNQIRFNYLDLEGDGLAGDDTSGATAGIKAANPTGGQFLEILHNGPSNTLVGTGKSTVIARSLPPADVYRFDLVAGQRVNLALTNTTVGNVDMQLIASDGTTVLANGLVGATNLNEAIQSYPISITGTYFARVSGDEGVTYSLVVTKDTLFDAEANNTLATAQDATNSKGALGFTSMVSGLYAISEGSAWGPATLYRLDPATGAILQTIGSTGRRDISDIDFHPHTGELYAIDNYLNQLIKINPFTAAVTVVGSTGGEDIEDISFRSDGTLFAWVDFGSSGFDDLATINLTTGAVTIIPSSISSAWSGLAFDGSDNLYLKARNTLKQVNPNNGAEISSVTLSKYPDEVLEFGPGNVLYTATHGFSTSTLQTINVATGVVTDIGTAAVDGIVGLAFTEFYFEDWYKVTLGTDESVVEVETRTAAGVSGQFVNNLNPKIQFFNSAGIDITPTVTILPDGRNEKFTATGLSSGQTYYVRVAAEGGSLGEYFVGIKPLRAPEITVAKDDGDWGFQLNGPGWSVQTGTGHQNDYRLHPVSAPSSATNVARWVMTSAGPTSEVFVSWVSRPMNATNATYKIYDGATLRGTVVVDQTRSPNDALLYGTTSAKSLGTFTFVTTQVRVELLTLGANGDLVADGVFSRPVSLVAATGSSTVEASRTNDQITRSPSQPSLTSAIGPTTQQAIQTPNTAHPAQVSARDLLFAALAKRPLPLTRVGRTISSTVWIDDLWRGDGDPDKQGQQVATKGLVPGRRRGS